MTEKQLEVEQRLAEIRESRRVWYGGQGQVTKDIDYLLSLLQQPANSERCGECAECHHDKGVHKNGICNAKFFAGGECLPCLCKCVFATIGAGEQLTRVETVTLQASRACEEFKAAHVAIWREIDAAARGSGYLRHGYFGDVTHDTTKRARCAWEQYRRFIDAPATVAERESQLSELEKRINANVVRMEESQKVDPEVWNTTLETGCSQRDDELQERFNTATPGEAAREVVVAAITDMQEGRDSHRQWLDHLSNPEREDCKGCDDHGAHIGDVEHHRQWIERYDRVIRLLALVPLDFPPTEAAQVAVEADSAENWKRRFWQLRTELTQARANAVRECAEKVKSLRQEYDDEATATEDYEYGASLGCAVEFADKAITALESLAKEGDEISIEG